MRVLRLPALVCLAFISISGSRALCQSAASQRSLPRITEKIDDEHLVPLSGNTLPVANSKNDLGRARPDLVMTDLVLVLSRSPEQQAAFDTFVASQYDPASPNFHHWLEAAEIGEQFGPSASDISAISSWLSNHGLAIAEVSKDRMSIRFSGNASQIEHAFHTEIHTLQVNGQKHIANTRDPQVPIALASVVAGLKALHDFHPRPLHHAGEKAQFDASTGKWTRTASPRNLPTSAAAIPHPDYGITVSTSSGSYPIEDVAPFDFATIYNVLPLWNAGTDGTGQTIAIAGTSDINPQDVANYRKVFGLPAGPPLKTIVANGVDPGQCTAYAGYCTIGDLFENTLDVEVSGSVAKNAQIDLVVSGQTSPITDTVYSSANYVIQNNTAKILSVSYGLCELFMGTGGNAAYNNLWETGAAEGIAIFVATGDAGSPTCDQNLATSLPYGARFGLSVNGLASSPYVTAVGGTDFTWCKPTINSSGQVSGCSTVSPYWNSTNSLSNGASAANYIPETPWNDSCASSLGAAYLESLAKYMGYTGVTDAEAACNFVVQKRSAIYQRYGIDLSFFVNSVGGGGGASTCTTNSTSDTTTTPDPSSCSGGYTKPSWQSGVTGIPSDGKRDIPDVSFFAGAGFWNSATLVCVSATGTCVTATSTSNEPTGQEVGGTSVATPQMAGVMALINQKVGVNQGSPNPELYSLAAKQSWTACTSETVKTGSSCYFNDVDASTIATPCEVGSLNCSITHTGNTWGLLSGFSAGKAYDQATGLGSLNIANVVNGWTSLVGTTPVTVTITPAQTTIVLDQPLQVAIKVTGSSGTPTGNVTIVGGGYDGGAQSLASGSYTFTIPAFSLSVGSYNLTGSYQGNSTYAQSSGTAAISVKKITPTLSVTLNPTSIGANTPITANITVAGSSSDPKPTGTVQLTAAPWNSSCILAAGTCSITIPVNTLPNGSDTVTVSYPGDSNYEAASGSAVETVNALTPSISAVVSPSSFYANAPFSVAVSITGSGSVPTGQISLTLTVNQYYPQTLQGQLVNGKYTFNVPANSVYAGQDRVQLSYAGNTTYLPAVADVPIKVTAAPTTTSVSISPSSVFTNTMLTLSGTISASSGTPSGSVTASFSNFSWIGSVVSGQYSITIPQGNLPAGADTIRIDYLGDSFYAPSTTSTVVNVAQWTRIAPTITITPAAATIGAGLQLVVAVAVSGSGGSGIGTVTLSAGSWSEGPLAINNGTATFYIPSNTLPLGTDTITANYGGDPTYLAASTTTNIVVNPSTFTLSPQNALTIVRGRSDIESIEIKTTDGYTGSITFTCALSASPKGASHLPTCSGSTAFMNGSFGSTVNTVNLQVATTGTTAQLSQPPVFRTTGFGGALFAIFILLGMPSRRRSLRAPFAVFLLFAVFIGLNACGGGAGGSTGGTGGSTNSSGTTPGVYTFTVTGTGSPAVAPTPTTTFTLTVN